jgi:hypothetical protein
MLHTDYKRKISLLELDAADTLGWFFVGSKILFFQFYFPKSAKTNVPANHAVWLFTVAHLK